MPNQADSTFASLRLHIKTLIPFVWDLFADRARWNEIRAIALGNPGIPHRDFIMSWLFRLYSRSQLVGLRALVDPDTGTFGLRSLLIRAQKNSHVLTFERLLALYGPEGHPGFLDPEREAIAKWCEGGLSVSPGRVQLDLDALEVAMRGIEDFVDQQLAHHDRASNATAIQAKDVDTALEVVARIARDYYSLLCVTYIVEFEPRVQLPWTRAFEVPWIERPT